MHNTNPYNYWDSVGQCWSTDPLCGLRQLPKRPYDHLKDPSQAMFKLQRDAGKPLRDQGFVTFY